MSIANELSSDVATALLAGKEKDASIEASELLDVVVTVHSTLQQLTAEARKGNKRSDSSQSPAPNSSASSGNH